MAVLLMKKAASKKSHTMKIFATMEPRIQSFLRYFSPFLARLVHAQIEYNEAISFYFVYMNIFNVCLFLEAAFVINKTAIIVYS